MSPSIWTCQDCCNGHLVRAVLYTSTTYTQHRSDTTDYTRTLCCVLSFIHPSHTSTTPLKYCYYTIYVPRIVYYLLSIGIITHNTHTHTTQTTSCTHVPRVVYYVVHHTPTTHTTQSLRPLPVHTYLILHIICHQHPW